MKIALSAPILLAALLSADAAPPSHVQPPPKARGHYRRFDAPAHGRGNIELFPGGPAISCDFHPGRGPKNARSCVDGGTAVTVVDADCPENLFGGNPNEKCFAASISEGATGKVYTVNSAGEVNERDTADYPEEEHPPNEDHPDDDLPTELNRRLRGGATPLVVLPEPSDRLLAATPVIDVLVVYTQGAKADAQNYGDGPIENLVNLAIAETNQAYANSGINAELRLAGGAPHEDVSGYTADVGSTSMSPSLNHLTSSTDGELDYVHQMRIDRGADMVALITTGAGCGIAWLSGQSNGLPSAGSQFSVTKYSCATGYYSFGHELGHNMGCHHDKGTTGACGSTNPRYGYRGTNGQYRSILSYSCNTSQCDSNVGGPCTRSQFFSTPDPTKTWNGQPMGADANDSVTGITDNAAHINAVAQRIADFYTAPPPPPSPTPPPPSPSPPTGTPAPTNAPTPQPTKAPVTPAPTNPPTTPFPTSPPTPGPTNAPTPLPTPAPPVTKYICSNKDKSPEEICATTNILGDSTCSAEGAQCGGGTNKSCRVATCGGNGPAPTPTPPSPSPPTTPTPPPPSPSPPTQCPVCGNGDTCCPADGQCSQSGKPSRRACLSN